MDWLYKLFNVLLALVIEQLRNMLVTARNSYGRTRVTEKLKEIIPGVKMEKSATIEKAWKWSGLYTKFSCEWNFLFFFLLWYFEADSTKLGGVRNIICLFLSVFHQEETGY